MGGLERRRGRHVESRHWEKELEKGLGNER